MDNDFFLSPGIPQLLHFDQQPMPTWHSLSAMEVHPPADLHFQAPATTARSSGCFFESTINSIVSSPGSASSGSFVIREMIGKLGSACNSGEISPPASGPLEMNFSAHMGNSKPPLGSDLPTMPGDPGFAERAARFSSFRSRSFNCRKSQFGSPNGSGSSPNPIPLTRIRKLQRVFSSPSLKVGDGCEVVETGNDGKDQGQFGNSRENSSVSEQTHPGRENGSSRKRKSAPKGKSKEVPSSPAQATQNEDDSIAKRMKLNEGGDSVELDRKQEGDESKNEDKNAANQKPPEPSKDYIHVRARRGQATDSHSLAERVRREKISERMKLLQDLVPGCNKVTGKALMLEEIINYVQSLQRQVEFLSMKLASINPSVDFNTSNPFQKDIFQPNCSMQTNPIYPLDPLAPTLYGVHHHPQNPLQQNGITGIGMGPLNQSHDVQLPPIDEFINGVHELPALCEGDLDMMVQMGSG